MVVINAHFSNLLQKLYGLLRSRKKTRDFSNFYLRNRYPNLTEIVDNQYIKT